MKRSAVAFFCCYPLLPVAFFCGMGLLDGRPIGLVALLYYGLLLASLWACRRLGGWASAWYSLAVAITLVHLIGVSGFLLNQHWKLASSLEDVLFGIVFLTIPGVFLAACLAGAALAFSQKRQAEAIVQLAAPFMLGTGVLFGSVPMVIAFFGQGLHALSLSLRFLDQGNPAQDLNDIGFTPESSP